MAKIFLSYSSKDREFARALSHKLLEYGANSIIDFNELAPGQDLKLVLTLGLKDADAYIVLISRSSVSSSSVFMEFGLARGYSSQMGRPAIIPIAIDDMPLPSAFQDIVVLRAPDRNLEVIAAQVQRALAQAAGYEAARETRAEETAKRLDVNAPDYIEEAIRSQRESEVKNRDRGRLWYIIGFVSLVGGILFTVTSVYTRSEKIGWISLSGFIITNVVVVGFLGACSRYAYSLGKAYTSESLKASDRIHAISFGKFYLSVFKERVVWGELKEVFQYWNIDRASTFSSLDANQIDPQILTLMGQVAKSFGGRGESQK